MDISGPSLCTYLCDRVRTKLPFRVKYYPGFIERFLTRTL